jgi:predicted proteasome-type protease
MWRRILRNINKYVQLRKVTVDNKSVFLFGTIAGVQYPKDYRVEALDEQVNFISASKRNCFFATGKVS